MRRRAGTTLRGLVIRTVVGPAEPLLGVLEDASYKHADGVLRVAVAWARDEGVARFFDALGGRMAQVNVIVGLNERGTTVEALLRLLPNLDSLRVFFNHPRQTLHHKVYWFEGPEEATTVLIRSSNLTRGGLMSNFETTLEATISQSPTGDEEALLAEVQDFWEELAESPFFARCARRRRD